MNEGRKDEVEVPTAPKIGPAAQFYQDVSSGNEQGPGIVINIPSHTPPQNSENQNSLLGVLNLVAIAGLLLAAVAGGTAIGAFLVDRTIESKVEDAVNEGTEVYQREIEDLRRRLEILENAQRQSP